jgi:hypothetical protein
MLAIEHAHWVTDMLVPQVETCGYCHVDKQHQLRGEGQQDSRHTGMQERHG